MILWSHLIICDLFLHKHLVIKSDHSVQQCCQRFIWWCFSSALQDLKMTEHPFELQAFFPPCFSEVFFSNVFLEFFLKFYLNCQLQMTELPFELQACFPRCPFATIWLTSHWKGKMSGKTRYNWNRIKNVKCVFYLKTFLTYLMCVAVIAGRAKRIIELT